jgi:hypothetical protein
MPHATVEVKMRMSGLAAVITFYFRLHILAFSVKGGVPRRERERERERACRNYRWATEVE